MQPGTNNPILGNIQHHHGFFRRATALTIGKQKLDPILKSRMPDNAPDTIAKLPMRLGRNHTG